MKYRVSLFYKDEQSLNVDVPENQIGQLFKDLSEGQVYKHPETSVGFWTNLQDIRYIIVKPEGEADGIAGEVAEISGDLPEGEGGDQGEAGGS